MTNTHPYSPQSATPLTTVSDQEHNAIAGRVGVPETHDVQFATPAGARFEERDDQFAANQHGHDVAGLRNPQDSGAEATPLQSAAGPATERPPDHDPTVGFSLDTESPMHAALGDDSDDGDYATPSEAEDYQGPTIVEMCRTRASEFLINVLQARSNRATTLERGTAALATLRDEVCHLAQQVLQSSDGDHAELPVLLNLLKQAGGLQKQIGQDFRLIAQLEKDGM